LENIWLDSLLDRCYTLRNTKPLKEIDLCVEGSWWSETIDEIALINKDIVVIKKGYGGIIIPILILF